MEPGPTDDDPMGQHAHDRLAAWLTDRPAGTRLPWGDAHLWLDPTAHAATWVDIAVPAACTDLGTSWTWTVVADTDEDAATAWPHRPSVLISLPPDAVVHVATDPATGWYDADGPRLVTALGRSPAPEDLLPVVARAVELGGEVVVVPAWTEAALTSAIAAWARAATGRADLVFARDPDWSPAWVGELAAGQADATGEHLDLGDGLVASDRVVDALLAMGPDAAAEITGQIKRVIANHRPAPPAPDGFDPPRP